MNLLQLHNATKQYGAKVLFDKARFAINQSEHVGVIGPNGAGKTTLFKILVGQETLDTGELTKANKLRIGYLEQESDWTLNMTAEEYLTEECIKPIWDLKQIGKGIGLSEAHFQKQLSELSGGYRMRMKLLYLIGLEPDLMLLDEPTNFLDLESILALEKFLQDYTGAFLLISHDREFLRRTTEYTLEVEGQEIIKFPGHIDDYFEQKEEVAKIKAQQAANLDAKRKHIQEFVDRFRAKATKAKQAQSRMKQLDKMETIEIKALPVRSRIHLPVPVQTGKEVLVLTNAELGYEGRPILSDVNLILERGAHLGVVGFNGAGKSTLLKSIAGRIPMLSGDRKIGYQTEISYFAQHLTEDLINEDTVIEALQRKAYTNTTKQEILGIAGSLLFTGDDIYKKIKVLSGGEKTRVALGQILLQKKPLLLMDEPTNHLDFDTVNALAEALHHFAGTLVVVSHDRSFINRVSNKIIEIRNGHVEVYPGTYEDYLWSLEKGALKERYLVADEMDFKIKQANKPAAESDRKFNYKEQSKKIGSEIKELQKKISKAEDQLLQLNKNLAEQNNLLITAQGPQAQKLAIESAQTSKKISDIEETMLLNMENLESKEKELTLLKQ
ncbi:MAG: ATP-binding cassette domain-containing protein [Bdellovibrio sp.]|nr:ATP-binding cassette domain-containing protein [Bdellovibrio sp.]